MEYRSQEHRECGLASLEATIGKGGKAKGKGKGKGKREKGVGGWDGSHGNQATSCCSSAKLKDEGSKPTGIRGLHGQDTEEPAHRPQPFYPVNQLLCQLSALHALCSLLSV